jgi:hypothetical protein
MRSSSSLSRCMSPRLIRLPESLCISSLIFSFSMQYVSCQRKVADHSSHNFLCNVILSDISRYQRSFLLFKISFQNVLPTHFLLHACYMSYSSDSLFDCSNNTRIRRRARVIGLLIIFWISTPQPSNSSDWATAILPCLRHPMRVFASYISQVSSYVRPRSYKYYFHPSAF